MTNCHFAECVHFAQFAWILGHLQSLFAWLGGGQDDAGGDPGVAGGLLALRHRWRRVHLSVRAQERHEVTRKVTGLNFFSQVLKTQTMDIFRRLMGPFGIVSWSQRSLNKVGHSWKSQQTQVALKVPRWHHNSAKIFRLVRKCMGLMTSWLRTFRVWSVLWAFVIPKLKLLFTREGWSAQPYSIIFVWTIFFVMQLEQLKPLVAWRWATTQRRTCFYANLKRILATFSWLLKQ